MLHDHGDHGNIWQPQTAEGRVVRCGHCELKEIGWSKDYMTLLSGWWFQDVSRIPYFQHFSTIFGRIITYNYCRL
jgi:hypothetical protein